MWHNRSLRTRILLGYGLILGLALALALFLILRVGTLNQNIQQLNRSVASETVVGLHMTTRFAATQQAVSRYLQQPQPAHLEAVHEALRLLTTEIEQAQATLSNQAQPALLEDLKHRLQIYHNTFESVSRLVKEQESLRASLNTHLSQAITILSNTIGLTQRNPTPPDQVSQLIAAQTSLQQANLWITRLASEQDQTSGANVVAELNKARLILKLNAGEPGSVTNVNINTALTEVALSTDLATRLIQSIEQVQNQRDRSLAEQGQLLEQQTDAIAQRATDNLTTTTGALARQTRQTQEITGAVLLIALMLVLIFGIGLAHTITQPLQELVAATTRLAQGDYDVTVAQSDGSEIGQLAMIFNHMTTTLKQQRAEMLCQQAAIVKRNQELEQALAEIKAATDAHTALSATVRTLSIPVVPILDNVIVVSLVGELDDLRARMLLDRLLEGIAAQHASTVILDVTGVPFVDPPVVEWLLKVVDAAKLLGAHCLLVGIRPEVAQAMVASGISLAGLATKATLQAAVEDTLETMAKSSPARLN